MANSAVTIDITPLTKTLERLQSPEEARRFSQLVLAEAAQTWTRAVSGEQLNGMSRPVKDAAYARAIQVAAKRAAVSATGFSLDVGGVYPKAQVIERGFPSYDMKPGLLNSAKAKTTKPDRRTGAVHRYLDVPFKHRTPTSGAQQGETPSGFATTMPYSVYRIAKQLTLTDPRNFGGGPVSGSYLPREGFGQYNRMRKGIANLSSTSQNPRHAYFTFRRVSSTSPQESWQHPGQQPNKLTAAVYAELQQQLPAMAKAFLADTNTE